MSLFPFKKVRDEQNKLIKDIETAITNESCLIAHAPTGLGKTAAAISPALEYALKNDLTVFFLTSRNTQHNLIIETLQKINELKPIIAVDFVGKKNMCPQMSRYSEKSVNFFEFCNAAKKDGECKNYSNTFAVGLYTEAAKEFAKELVRGGPIKVEEMVNFCSSEFCAYELSMYLAQNANVIVADYYHIFSPKVQKFFLNKIKKDLSKAIIIVDEAHNLPDRIRSLLTKTINSFVLRKAAKDIKKVEDSNFSEIIAQIETELNLLAVERLAESDEVELTKQEFIDAVETASGQKYADFVKQLEEVSDEIVEPDEEDNVAALLSFLKNWLGPDMAFVRVLKKQQTESGREFISLEYNCLAPDVLSKQVFGSVHSAILMSGTLVPTEMYRDVLGLSEKTILKVYKNPFPQKNRKVLISPDITTKYSERTDQMFKKIATSCAYIINGVDGNSAVFFPSYNTLTKTLHYLDALSSKRLFVETRGMTKTERTELINSFKKNIINGGGAILGVQGASYSEGIDLPGDLLKAVAVVGIPLAPPDLKQKAVIAYYEKKFGNGWDYGYIFPAMNRALQAAGRCIRSETDKGVIAFLDKRFSWSKYSKIIPPDWNAKVVSDFSKVKYF